MIKVGQTWRTKGGAIVTVSDKSHVPDRFVLKRENGAQGYTVDARGISKFLVGEDLGVLMTRTYIAGPMTGHADLNFPAFHAAAKLYRDRGCYVINPAEINGGDCEPELYAAMSPEEKIEHWGKCMRRDITALVTCEMIVMLPGWNGSRGALLEWQIAKSLGMAICYQGD